MESLIGELEAVLNERFAAHAARMPGPVPAHEVRFSKRITESWALIYYRRHLVRLSPYLFLLEPHELKHASYWQELDATLKHEAVHAYLYARDGTRHHSPEFTTLLAGLGVDANGACDLGPTNRTFRYEYGCPDCGKSWQRRTPLRANWSCGGCSPGRYAPEKRLVLVRTLAHPWERLRECRERVAGTLAEARENWRTVPVRARDDMERELPALRGKF